MLQRTMASMLQRTKCGVAHTSGVHGRACESCTESNECDGGNHHNEHLHLGVAWPFQPRVKGHQRDGVCQHCLHHHPYCGMHFELRPTNVLLVLGWCQMHHRLSSRHCTHHLGTQTFSERFQILSPAPCYTLGLTSTMLQRFQPHRSLISNMPQTTQLDNFLLFGMTCLGKTQSKVHISN